ncbi:pyrroline-5-carboxylate reductase [Lachnotalea glycerini]|uniref:Pyrroline-5-carboxylate reductase n=1 Tax=Lachnotalea glycerini TaxID=1763509 RepID=A0A255ILZ6_9FIRM|nr:pyrroline-5-carboxylate reductase [Lachnotalea glycerini]PXV95999.1 pyrroline-5-carboxylate reductase [Lachnotalea glycerini]RDY32956.1 pyrroline-5-carboxylate reductase [Lachnotalea glycerini]
MSKIGFVGMGNMGYAMLKGALNVFSPDELSFTDVNEERCKNVLKETGVNYYSSNAECTNNNKYIILAVKPQYYDQVIKNIKYVITQEQVIISIAPGITIEELNTKLGADKRIMRLMPNTPALLGAGMTGISYNKEIFSDVETDTVNKLLTSFSKAEYVEERLMSAVTCASGSSPAYVYMFIEALADSVVKYGLPRDQAYEFVAQTVKGAAEMVLVTKEHPGRLKDQVCSPGGTTIAGVAALEEYGFRNAIMKATDECYARAEKIK